MPTLNPIAAPQQSRWHVFSSVEALEEAAVQRILQAAEDAIAARGAFHVVLAGGTTPRNVYRRLRNCEAEWASWHVYFGDERCLHGTHPERNSLMAQEAWLDHVPIPGNQIYPIPAEFGAEDGADAYVLTLEKVAEFDLVLLGLGEDGHTASLFPGQAWEQAEELRSAIPVHEAPKPPPDRVSLCPWRLSAAREVLFLVTGAGKRAAVDAWRSGAPIPAASIAPESGVDVFIDASLA